MLLKEITELLEKKLSPKLFRLNSEVYGIQYGQINKMKLIKKVMFTVDLSLKAIHFAVKNKINLIISHHGLINNPIQKFNQNMVNKLSLLSNYPCSIFILNSSFIAAEGGISDTLSEVLYLKLDRTFNIKNKNGEKVPIGRICLPKKYPNQNGSFNLEDLIKRIKLNMDIKRVLYVGDLNKQIRKICVLGGEISNKKYIEKSIKYGCDCYISGRINYYDAIFARDIGFCLIEICHYNNEILALKKLCNIMSLEFPHDEFFLFESKNPLKTY
ncbi:MAG: Nif3-like dinuclear metal center hexameric protein [Promethearchaeota archaeon]